MIHIGKWHCLHLYVVDFRPLPDADNTIWLNLCASSTNSQLAREVPSCEMAQWWIWIRVRACWMLYW